MPVSARSSARPDPPFKDIYATQNKNNSIRTSSNYRQPTQENPNGVSYAYSESQSIHHDRVRTRAMRNVSLLDDKNAMNSQTVIPSRHLNTPALRKTGEPYSKQTARSSSRQRAFSLDPRSLNVKQNSNVTRIKSTNSQIKSLQKELDEVKFFREIEETGMEARKAKLRSGIPLPAHHQKKQGPSMQNRLYENELEIKTLDLKLKSSNEEKIKLTKKLKTIKGAQEQKKTLEEKMKVVEKQNKITKKENVSLEERIREMEKTIEKQKQELKQKARVDQKVRKKDEEIDFLQKDLQKQKKNNKTLDKQINDCIETIEVAELQLSKSRLEISELKKHNNGLQQCLDNQRTDLEKKENYYDEKNDEALDLQAKIDELNEDLLQVKGLLEEKQNECIRKEEELHTLAEEAEANSQKVGRIQVNLTEVIATKESLSSQLEKSNKENSVLEQKRKEVNDLLVEKNMEVVTKDAAIAEANKTLANLEDRYNDTKELLESNKVILDMHKKETVSLKKQAIDQESRAEKDAAKIEDLKTEIIEMTEKMKVLEDTLTMKENEFEAGTTHNGEKIEVLTIKIADLEQELEKFHKSKEETLSMNQSKWEKIESILEKSVREKQQEIDQLEKNLLREKSDRESSEKKYNMEVPELQKKLENATQKLIDTMSSSLANGRELEEYRSKVSNSEAKNEEKIRTLQQSLDEANRELVQRKETIEQYNQVSEKLCVEIEETKYHHDLEIEELEESIESLKSELEVQRTQSSNETHTEVMQLREKYTKQVQELQSEVEKQRILVKKERARYVDISTESDSLEIVFRSLRSKFSSILSNYNTEFVASVGNTRNNQSLITRLNELSDSVVATFHKIEQDMATLRNKMKRKEIDMEEMTSSYKRETGLLKNQISEYASDLAKGRIRTSSIQTQENELRKSLHEEREKLRNAMIEIENVTSLSQENSENFTEMKARSDAHITALHTALEDAKADIAQLESLVKSSSSNRDRSVSNRSVSSRSVSSRSTSSNSNDDVGSVARRLRAERLSSSRGRDTHVGTRNEFSRNSIGISPRGSSMSRARSFSSTHSKSYEPHNFSLDNLGTTVEEYPDPDSDFDEVSHDSSEVEDIEFGALSEFMSMRTQRNNEI